jgi:hypothetical protein
MIGLTRDRRRRHAVAAGARWTLITAGATAIVLVGALYRVAATFEDTTVEEGAEDPAGRPATVLVHTRRTGSGTERTEIFFDPRTAASLGTRTTTTGATQTWVYTPPASVDSVTARP